MALEKPSITISHRIMSAALLASLLFGLVNLGLALTQPQLADRFEFPYHGWSYWSLKAIRNSDLARANVALLGSSLVVAAMAECDATVANKPLDLCYYKGAKYFDSQMRQRFRHEYSTFDLSTPGQIPSDAYLTLKAALANGLKPGVVIYGIAPRDFIDQTLSDPCDTEPFRYLSRLVDISDCKEDLLPAPFARTDWLLQQALPLYGNAAVLSAQAKSHCSRALEQALLSLTAPWRQRVMDLPLSRLSPELQSFDKAPGTNFALPAKPHAAFLDNLEDYKNRYKKPDSRKYSIQMRFFERLITLCQSNGTAIIIVNMPITRQNCALLQRSWLSRYHGDIDRLCRLHNVSFLDQCDFTAYSRDDYRDTVHLNAFGARKFIDRLVERLAKEPAPAGSRIQSGPPSTRSLAAHTEGTLPGIHY